MTRMSLRYDHLWSIDEDKWRTQRDLSSITPVARLRLRELPHHSAQLCVSAAVVGRSCVDRRAKRAAHAPNSGAAIPPARTLP